VRAKGQRQGVVDVLGAIAAIVAWLGWFQVAPALGFPTIGPAAMVNRVFVFHSNPGAWIGWTLLVMGLAIVVALYEVLEVRGMIPRGAVFGLLFGVTAWAVAGLVVMPIIGHISGPAPAPAAPPGIPTSPDPMHATFMMLHLGALAPVEALLAWLLFGAALGAASGVRSDGTAADNRAPAIRLANPTVGLLGAVILVTMLFAGAFSAPRAGAMGAAQPVFTGASTHVLGTGNVPMLPPGNDFVSVLELSQAAGATLGPHAGHTGFAYGTRGQAIIALAGGPTLRLEPGQAGFIGGVVHTHENRQGGLPAVLLAVGLLGLGLGLVLTGYTKWSGKRTTVSVLSVLLLAGGALALGNPGANEWIFIGVRPESARGSVMPLPDATRVYESPDLKSLSPGPYVETLEVITVAPGSQAAVSREPGAELLLVLVGGARVQLDGAQPIQLGVHQAALAQEGATVTLSNSGAGELTLLSFRVTAAPSAG
jgi:quercetin dioxygenase-like cupin family protein